MLLGFRYALRRPLPHLVAAFDVFAVGCEILRRLLCDPLAAGFACEPRDVRGDILSDGALYVENVAQLRLISPGKEVSLIAGLNELYADCNLILGVSKRPF